MTALLTDNLPLLAGAPNGIKKLRELILELAVRGKLVEQDPSDEPASELLKRIAEEKARLVAEGKIRKQKALAEIAEKEKPFELPLGWAWACLGELAVLHGGSTPSMSRSEFWGGSIPWVSPKDMHVGNITDSVLKVTQRAIDETSLELVPIGSILIVGRSGILKRKLPSQVTAVACTINQDLKAISPYKPLLSRYVQLMFQGAERLILLEDVKQGTTVQSLIYSKLLSRLFGLPPLAEQQRIVAKVDELMALCDRLEAQQADAESAHAQLMQALLDSLAQASDAADFAANWQRLAEHFHTLFTTESSIDALKQTLLRLAVMGKLVPQDSSDEPASELLKRIAEEKARLVADGKLKKQRSLQVISEEEKLFALPEGWAWVRKAETSNFLNGYAFKSEWFKPEGVRLLRNVNVSHGVANWNDTACISEERAGEFDGFQLAENDLVLTLDRPIISTGLKYAVVRKSDLPCLLLQRVAKIAPYAGSVTVNYLSAWLNSRFFVDSIDPGRSNGVPHISTNQVASMPFALPPIAEQHRIVAKLDQLMALCDQLKTRLIQARQLNQQLASTLVEKALAVTADTDQSSARTLLAAEVVHRLHGQRTFGQRKLQKVVHLAEHVARLQEVQGEYLRDAAGPHDRRLMTQIESELQQRQWYERYERDTLGHAYRPLSAAGSHSAAYRACWPAAARATIEQLIELMREWNTDRCEQIATLYAAWNDLLIEGREPSEEAVLDEVLHRWNGTKKRFGKADWQAALGDMHKHPLLIPSGFGRRTIGGMQDLPGFE